MPKIEKETRVDGEGEGRVEQVEGPKVQGIQEEEQRVR